MVNLIYSNKELILNFLFLSILMKMLLPNDYNLDWKFYEMEIWSSFGKQIDMVTRCDPNATCSTLFPLGGNTFPHSSFVVLGGPIDFWHPYQHNKICWIIQQSTMDNHKHLQNTIEGDFNLKILLTWPILCEVACPRIPKPFVGDSFLHPVFCTTRGTYAFTSELELPNPFVNSFHSFITSIDTLGFKITRPFLLHCIV
jgi:hypothetical protein